ncbi:putative quinol monooxygenase [Herbiconiux solani]|uniref:putative quinol monooxygenase n=1 Tax=Herbiconiux solani TaxID=661329 RepID=UPI00082637FA|nr:antibiotic biosynthesis monooxygenase family protein [Herbiconiux solani]
MTVLSLLDVRIRPDALESAPSVISDVLTATRAFPGSLGVEVVVDVDDPEHYVLVERWASMDDDDAYRAWRSTPEGASDLGSILAGPPSLVRTVVADGV